MPAPDGKLLGKLTKQREGAGMLFPDGLRAGKPAVSFYKIAPTQWEWEGESWLTWGRQ